MSTPSHRPRSDFLRHARLCEPDLGRNDVRATVDQVDGEYRVEVAARDRLGLIAHITARCRRRLQRQARDRGHVG